MIQYNYRTMTADAVRRAVDAARKANLGIVAMKTQGGAGEFKEIRARSRRGSTSSSAGGIKKEQAAIKAVFADERIQVVVSEMTNRDELRENTAATREPLTPKQSRLLEEYRAADGPPLLPRLRPPLRDRRQGRARRDGPPIPPLLRGLWQAAAGPRALSGLAAAGP